MEKLAVIGLGKLGLCTAACFAARGFTVYGYDQNPAIAISLRHGDNPIREEGLDELLFCARERLHVVDDLSQALHEAGIFFIIVPTPSGKDHLFDNRFLLKVLEDIAPVLRERTDYPLVNIVSTVVPGSCDQVFRPLLEQRSGRKCGVDFGLLYNPEFIALGSVIRDFLHPDLVLIGASDDSGAQRCAEVYRAVVENTPKINTMSLLNAELTKLALNCCVTTKISFVNGLADLCENIPGADVDIIATAIGGDSRIGMKYLRAGAGFGGTCFPRDNEALLAFASQIGLEENALLADRVVAVNNRVKERLHRFVNDYVIPGERVAVLGLSYKPGTHIVERSQGFELALELAAKGYLVTGWDPLAVDEAQNVARSQDAQHGLLFFGDLYECVRDAKCIVACNPSAELCGADWKRISLLAPNACVIDVWRQLKEICTPAFRYRALGVGQ